VKNPAKLAPDLKKHAQAAKLLNFSHLQVLAMKNVHLCSGAINQRIFVDVVNHLVKTANLVRKRVFLAYLAFSSTWPLVWLNVRMNIGVLMIYFL
jgi:hypothetical protein